jgi:hypothetical protein
MTSCRVVSEPKGGIVHTETSTCELAARENDGVCVRLLWHPRMNAVTVSVEDTRVGDRFHVAVAADRALDAFYHPFAYAA